MKITASLLFLLFFTALSAQQNKIPRTTGIIDAVTVYSDRALVERTEKLKSRGSGSIIFTDLPYSLMRDAVRARAKGAVITGVSLRPIVGAGDEIWAEHPLKIQIENLDKQLKIENNNLNIYREQLKVLKSFAQLSTAQTDREARANQIRIQTWGEALRFLEERRRYYVGKMHNTNETIRKLRKKRRKVQAKFSQLTKTKRRASVEVEVSYTEARPGTRVTLEYMVSRVSWAGFYDIRGSSEGEKFKVVAHASIRQSTGENWLRARITLSTASPAVSTSPGILKPWRLKAGSLKSSTNTANNDKRRGRFDESTVGSGSSADAGETSTFAITLPGRETIKSDNAAHKVTLKSSELRGKLTHVAVPSLSNFVYLKARLRNTSGMPLLWGNFNIFLDKKFVGTTKLRQRIAAGSEFDLFLGADQRMQLKRVLLLGEVEGSGVFTKSVEVVNKWQIEVANFTKKSKEIIIYDRYPVPADPAISTKFLGSNRSEVKKDENGILSWKLNVNSGQKIKVDFKYSISFPRDMWNKFVQAQEKASNELEADQFYEPQKKSRPKQRRQYNLEQMFH